MVVACRPASAAALRSRPIEVDGLSRFSAAVEVASHPQEIGSAEYLIVTVKTPDTLSALELVAGAEFGAVLSLQNGVVKDEQLASRFGQAAVVGACTMLGATRLAPGKVSHTLAGATYFGELDGSRSDRCARLAEVFGRARMRACIPEDIRSAEWSKLCRIVPGGLLSALSRLEFHRVCRSPDLARLFVAITRECAAVARAVGVPVGDYEGLAVRSLADAPFEDAVASVVARGEAMERAGQTGARISMLQDVLAARPTEVEETVGYVVRLARDLGVPVPNVEFGYRAIRGVESYFA